MFGLRFSVFATVSFLVVIRAGSEKAPPFLSPCSRSDPDLDQCATKSGRIAIPEIIKGSQKLKFPNMLPLKIPEINFVSGDLNIKFNNVELFGFETSKLREMKLDLKGQNILAVIDIPKINLISDYKIDGKILILPITGEGRANLTLANGEFRYRFEFDKVVKHGEEFMQIRSSNLEYNTDRSYYYFGNLLAAGKSLGIDVNQFLDDNWKDVQQDIGPALSETINQIITGILKGIFSILSYNELFLP